MSMYMSANQKTAGIVLLLLCITGLIVMWSIMGYKNGLRHANDPSEITPEQACIAKGGVPLMDGPYVKHCEGLRP